MSTTTNVAQITQQEQVQRVGDKRLSLKEFRFKAEQASWRLN